MPNETSRDAINDAVTRGVAIAALLGIAVVHVLQSPDAFREATYLGILFIVAIVASVVMAAVLTQTGDERVELAAGAMAALILICYILSRTSGLPSVTNNIGEWTNPLGLVSMVAEALMVCVAAGRLAGRRMPAGIRRDRPRMPRSAAPRPS